MTQAIIITNTDVPLLGQKSKLKESIKPNGY